MPAATVVRDITDADYVQDPARFGTPESAACFPGFRHCDMRTSGAIIRLRHGGSGPPLLLLHGNPETHFSWYRVASRLAEHYTVVMPDLRGYGDSSLPEPGENHINYSFRALAQDAVEVMEGLGFTQFYLAGVDRGGRTAHRLCLDHPERVKKVCLMDVLPNHFVWENVNKEWLIRTWHWAFMAQPEPIPETMIAAVQPEYFLKSRMVIRGGTGTGFLSDLALAEYVRCYTWKTITGSCRDYRATATCDHEMDTADKDKQVEAPMLLLWGDRGQSKERSEKFISVWSQYARTLEKAEPLICGHYMQEEEPDLIIRHYTEFFRG